MGLRTAKVVDKWVSEPRGRGVHYVLPGEATNQNGQVSACSDHQAPGACIRREGSGRGMVSPGVSIPGPSFDSRAEMSGPPPAPASGDHPASDDTRRGGDTRVSDARRPTAPPLGGTPTRGAPSSRSRHRHAADPVPPRRAWSLARTARPNRGWTVDGPSDFRSRTAKVVDKALPELIARQVLLVLPRGAANH